MNATATETVEPALSNTKGLEGIAQTLADLIDANEEASKVLNTTLEAQETAKRGPVSILYDVMLPVLGDLDDAGCPRIIRHGTEEQIKNSPHLMKFVRANKNGENRTINTDFYALMSEDTEQGKKDRFVIEQCDWALSADNNHKAEQAYRNLSRDALDSMKTSANSRLTNRRRLFRVAAEIFFLIKDITDKMADKVGVDFVTYDLPKGSPDDARRPLVTAANCIYVWDVKSPSKGVTFSAGSFVKLDVKKAIANGGSYTALLDTMKRDSDGKNKVKTTAGNDIPTAEKAIEATYALSSYFGADDPDAKNISAYIKQLSKDGEALLAFGDFAKIVADIMGEVEGDYIRLNDAKSAAARADMVNKAKAVA